MALAPRLRICTTSWLSRRKLSSRGLVNAVHVHKTAPVAGKKAGKILDQLLKFLKGKISAQNPGIRVKLDGIVEGICI